MFDAYQYFHRKFQNYGGLFCYTWIKNFSLFFCSFSSYYNSERIRNYGQSEGSIPSRIFAFVRSALFPNLKMFVLSVTNTRRKTRIHHYFRTLLKFLKNRKCENIDDIKPRILTVLSLSLVFILRQIGNMEICVIWRKFRAIFMRNKLLLR